ncbi:MAG: hypothetical protein WC217_00600 [Candidatus Paceibacterota bacterium]|jgi:hypothetical protein
MKTTIAGVLVAFIIGGGAGYFAGNGANSSGVESKKLQESIVMMKEQSASIQDMAQMMQSNGTFLQDIGMKYNDETTVSKGKDMEAIGAKYMKADATASAGSDTMGEVMR